MIKHDEIYLKEDWTNNDVQQLKKKDVWNEIQFLSKKMRFIYWLIDLILKQTTKIFYHWIYWSI